jgi:hypothetical protein
MCFSRLFCWNLWVRGCIFLLQLAFGLLWGAQADAASAAVLTAGGDSDLDYSPSGRRNISDSNSTDPSFHLIPLVSLLPFEKVIYFREFDLRFLSKVFGTCSSSSSGGGAKKLQKSWNSLSHTTARFRTAAKAPGYRGKFGNDRSSDSAYSNVNHKAQGQASGLGYSAGYNGNQIERKIYGYAREVNADRNLDGTLTSGDDRGGLLPAQNSKNMAQSSQFRPTSRRQISPGGTGEAAGAESSDGAEMRAVIGKSNSDYLAHNHRHLDEIALDTD